jgi:hypothetical protein
MSLHNDGAHSEMFWAQSVYHFPYGMIAFLILKIEFKIKIVDLNVKSH